MLTLLLALQIPLAALTHREAMTASAYRVFGPGAPVATLAGQIHQESAWRTEAVSWVGAQGLAQFMPTTARDMARLYPALCAPADPHNPRWAFACRDRYLKQLKAPFAALAPCSAWAFAFRAYNGGAGWVFRDRRQALVLGRDPNDWRAVGEVNAGRRPSAHRENKEYPERIFRIARRYHAAGWGAAVSCL